MCVSTGAPTALVAFLDTFTTLTESYWFYNHTEELKYDKDEHLYFRVDPDLGNLTPLYGVTTVLKIIDRSAALTPWAAKMAIEKLLRTIPTETDPDGTIYIKRLTLADFTKLALEAKGAHKEKLDEAGDIGHLAHKCLEDSIQFAIDNTDGVVKNLLNIPTDEKAKSCAEAAFAWMQRHNVRWFKTERKIYSKEFGYAGTMDGKALVDACDDPTCCSEQFKDSLSIIDWKSSNSLHTEYIFQAAGAYLHAEVEEYGEDFQNCFVLRLGKNEDEAGKFEPWRIPAKYFPMAFEGFLASLRLVKLVDEAKEYISTQKKGVRELKKQIRTEQKAAAKLAAQAKRAIEKEEKKLARAAERERIKAEAKKNREEAKLAKVHTGTNETTKRSSASCLENRGENLEQPGLSSLQTSPASVQHTAVQLQEEKLLEEKYAESRTKQKRSEEDSKGNVFTAEVSTTEFEEGSVGHAPFVIPEEG